MREEEMKKIVLICVYVLIAVLAFAAVPGVRNVVATPVSGQVNISYDLSADGDCEITVLVSNDNGASYKIIPTALSGTGYGDHVSPGTGKQIIWQPGAETPAIELGPYYKLRVIARDNPTQDQHQFYTFIRVDGGTFSRQESNGSYPDPEVMVTLSSFYIDKYEITQADYRGVMGTWDPDPRDTGFTYGVSDRCAVYNVSWYNAIEYCNRRSMQGGLTPCYSYNNGHDYGTNPDNWPTGWNTSDSYDPTVRCNWTANGYRLPTEMEWMFAAKGGNQSQGYTYSGGNDLWEDFCWYEDNNGYTVYSVGITPVSNELGIYDMSGNVWEWCWDNYGGYPSGPQTNPHGPTSGWHRVLRGGGFWSYDVECTVSYRITRNPTDMHQTRGFRCVRNAPDMVYVEGGTFNNGTSDVTLSSFYIDTYEVTQTVYQTVMDTNPSHFTSVSHGPVEQVSWFNAIEYCNRRSIKEGLTPCYSYIDGDDYGTNPSDWPERWNEIDNNHRNVNCNWTANGYRLPTEMEWKFAARGGNQTHNYTYSGSNDLNEVGWYHTNSASTTHPVGSKASNELGIFDMSGNVYEWCWDKYGLFYPTDAQTDPHGPTSGYERVKCGGSWIRNAAQCTASSRVNDAPADVGDITGFRCVRVSP